MRLLFISNPNNIHTRRWVSWFARHGHEVCVIGDTRLVEPWPGVELFDLPARFDASALRWPAWALWTRQIVHRWRPDVLHAHRVSSAGWLAAASGFHPLVITPWGTDLYQHPQRSRLARWLAGFVLRRADLATADSQDLRRQAIHFGAAAERSHVVQWGVDTAVFRPGDSAEWRQRLALGAAPVILRPRAVHPIYNLDSIVAALPAVRASFPGAVLVLRDYNTDAATKAQLQSQIAALRLQDAVRWVGPLPRYEDSAGLYCLADVAVSVPTSDGTPVSVLEAMACGAPIVASDLPSLREWITPGDNGLLVLAGDAQALAQAIVELLADPLRRAAFSQRNLDLIRQRADHDVEMGKMEALYVGLAR